MKSKIIKETNWGVFLLLLCALFLLINWLGYRHYHRWDLSASKDFSLSQQSTKVLKGLKKPLKVIVLISPVDPLYQRVRDLLSAYEAASTRVSVRYVDPDRDPAKVQELAKKYGLSTVNVVVFDYGKASRQVKRDQMADFDFSSMRMGGPARLKAFKAEEAFTNAILDLLDPRKPIIYFTTGHGERISAGRGMGMDTLKARLAGEGAEVKEWRTLGSARVPEDTDLLVIAGPEKPFLKSESELIERYLKNGGSAFIMLDPVILPGKPPTFGPTGLEALAEEWGVKPLDDIVLDPAGSVPSLGAQTFLSLSYGASPIVRDLARHRYPVLFSLARSLETTSPVDKDYTVEPLASSSSKSWGLRSLKHLDKAAIKKKGDPSGPLVIAAAVSSKKKEKKARLVLTGDSDVGSDALLRGGAGNLLFCMNAMHWLLSQENRIAIPPKTETGTHLTLTRRQSNTLFVFLVLILPFIVLAIGVYVFFQRRR